MKKRFLLSVFLTMASLTFKIHGQAFISKPLFSKIDVDRETKSLLFRALDTLFSQIDRGKLDTGLIVKSHAKLAHGELASLRNYKDKNKDTVNFYKRQVINVYPLSKTEYMVSFAYIGVESGETPVLKAVIEMVAKNENGKFLFSLPLDYYTKNWKTKTIGNVTYRYWDHINLARAKAFDKKNSVMAKKLGLKTEKPEFYLCNNYEEALRLLGYAYDVGSIGQTRWGYGVVWNTIFSTMHNEDFSHDLFHLYAGKIRKIRNWTAEEGVAYSWGDAYWTKENGEIVSQRELVMSLKKYLQDNPQTNLLELFDKDPKIFNHLAKEVSVQSTLSGLICDAVEKKKGTDGIKHLLDCGKGIENYFKAVNDLIQINRENFDKEVMKLVKAYK